MEMRDNGGAILAMMIAMIGFISNDSLIKAVSLRLPLGEIIFLRGLLAAVLIIVICAFTGTIRQFNQLKNRSVALRTIAEVFATICYLTALFQMQIANATALLQALPLMVTAGAALFLGAPVGWRRWSAIGVGFIGVLLIVRPGLEGFNIWSLVALLGVFFMSVRDLSTQTISSNVPTFGVSLCACIGVAFAGAGMASFETWLTPTPDEFFRLLGAAGFLLMGYVAIIIAIRTGDVSVVAPFRYSIIVWALIIGYFVWGDVPDYLTMFGTAIIVMTGIYTFFRERKLQR